MPRHAAGARASLAAAIKASREKEFALESPALELGYSYAGSPVVVPDGGPGPVDGLSPDSFDDAAKWEQTTAVGGRAPHGWVSETMSTLDLFGYGFTLLSFGDPDKVVAERHRLTVAAARRGLPLSSVHLADRELAELYERRLVLVRPDGHVAWRGDRAPADPLSVVDTVRGAGG